MSAGLDHPTAESLVVNSLDGVAPKFRDALEAALADCDAEGLDAIVYESLRSDELQRIYWARGRRQLEDGSWEVVNENAIVTRAKTAQFGWHFFGLAADLISESKRWEVTDEWREQVNTIMREHGLDCGADWPHPDMPHVQWGKCKRSPSGEARRLYAQGGLQAVWEAVGAAA